jgi:hypothetical protein
VTPDEDWAACAASVDPELIEATFPERSADLGAGLPSPRPAGERPALSAWTVDAAGRGKLLVDRACWDEDAARNAVRAFMTRHLGADGGSAGSRELREFLENAGVGAEPGA